MQVLLVPAPAAALATEARCHTHLRQSRCREAQSSVPSAPVPVPLPYLERMQGNRPASRPPRLSKSLQGKLYQLLLRLFLLGLILLLNVIEREKDRRASTTEAMQLIDVHSGLKGIIKRLKRSSIDGNLYCRLHLGVGVTAVQKGYHYVLSLQSAPCPFPLLLLSSSAACGMLHQVVQAENCQRRPRVTGFAATGKSHVLRSQHWLCWIAPDASSASLAVQGPVSCSHQLPQKRIRVKQNLARICYLRCSIPHRSTVCPQPQPWTQYA